LVVFTTQTQKDARKLATSGLREKAEDLLEVLRTDPWQQPPRFERLVGDLAGAYSRRINVQRRLVYQVLPKQRTVKVLRMWTHYE
jgi:Txe/YoeB family toxin of toxin-antitoxin system